MLIAQISDTHLLADGSQAGARRRADLARTVAHINALAPRPDAVLHTGDVAQNGSAREYGLAREILSGLANPLFATVGNRDRRAAFAAAFARDGYLPADAAFVQYAAELGALRLVAADTLSEEGPTGAFCDARLAALEAILEAAPGRPTLLFLHHPPAAVPALSNPWQFARDDAARLARLIGRHRQIVRVLCGHTHRADSVPLGAVTATTMPSIATDLRKDRYPPALTETPVYQLHTLSNDGEVASRTLAVA